MRAILLLSTVVLALACSERDPLAPRASRQSFEKLGSLENTVSITPARPAPGDYVTISSVIVNRGSAPVDLTSRICGLDYAGSLRLVWPAGFAKCAAYSMNGAIAPGDSVVGGDLMQVSGVPGRYNLRVRHALDPEIWVDLEVEVSR